jgi:chromate transporter
MSGFITTLVLIAYEFFKTGLFTIGGGLATLPFLLDIAERYPHWYTTQTVMDMIAISESTPGPLGVNMATYAGYSILGFWGSLTATFFLILPTLIIASIVARFLARFNDNPTVQAALVGLRAAGTGMITAAGIGVFRVAVLNLPAFMASGQVGDLFNLTALAMFIVFVAAMAKFKKVHPVVFLAIAAVLGIFLGL